MNSVELFIANTFYLHEAAFLADNSARELGNLYSMKKRRAIKRQQHFALHPMALMCAGR